MAETTHQLRHELERNREELAATVQALARKADVKHRLAKVAANNGEALKKNGDAAWKKATEATDHVRQLVPDDVQQSVEKAATEVTKRVRKRSIPYSVILVALLLLALAVRGRMRSV